MKEVREKDGKTSWEFFPHFRTDCLAVDDTKAPLTWHLWSGARKAQLDPTLYQNPLFCIQIHCFQTFSFCSHFLSFVFQASIAHLNISTASLSFENGQVRPQLRRVSETVLFLSSHEKSIFFNFFF
jgi:hypothetical protein